MAPENILAIEDKLIRDCGISYPKISYIKLLSTAVRSGEIDLIELNNLGSDEVIFELTKIKGVGRWTAEMFLMSTLKHPDIFSVGDLGLRKAVSNLYGVDRNDHKTILSIAERWKPYRTFASRYLWRSLDED